MERVLGIGGFFFRAKDAAGLNAWYAEHFGVVPPPMAYDAEVWIQEEGPTVFAPFDGEDADSPYLGAGGWGINFRVADLDAMAAQLRAAGIAVDIDETEYPNGRFAQVADPEGNSIQLWQPS